VVALLFLVVIAVSVVILQESNIRSWFNCSEANPSPTPAPTEIPLQFVVTNVTASPSNSTPGLVTVVAQVKNQGIQNQTVLIVMQIQEPNGNIMSITNSNATLEIRSGGSNTTTFLPIIPLNVKIGKFNVDIDVYDLNQTTEYYSTGFIYPFTTPIRYSFTYPTGARQLCDIPLFNMNITVDGTTYKSDDPKVFYWYLGTNHTVTVPVIALWTGMPGMESSAGVHFVRYEYAESEHIVSEGNVLHISVTADTPTIIEIYYGPNS
jgi:hypothetical protein